MLEFALAASTFFFIVLGIIDFGLTLFDLNATTAGAREGGHAAAAWIGTSTEPTTCAGLTTTSFSGPGNDAESLRIICRTKNRLTTAGGSRSRVRIRFEDVNGTASDGVVTNDTTNRFIVVCVQVKARSITGLFSPVLNRMTLMARSRYRLEYSAAELPFNIRSGGETFFDTSKAC